MKTLYLTSQASNVIPQISKQINKKGAKVIFIITPSETSEGSLDWLDGDRDSLKKVGYDVTDYTITGKTRNEIKKDIEDFDIMFVSGGNTFYLLEKIQQSGCVDILKKFVEQGKPYIGSSAGSVVTGPDISPAYDLDRVEKAPNIKDYIGLGLVDFVTLPHWGSEKFKELYLNDRINRIYTEKYKLIFITDKQYVHVKNDWYQIKEVK